MPVETPLSLELNAGGKRLLVHRAGPYDVMRIRWLYNRVYGGAYPFSLVYDPKECAKAIESDRYLWLLARDGDQAAASLVFTVDKGLLLAKVFGGVVAEEYRGHDVMEKMLSFGLEVLVNRQGAAKSVYATARTVDLAPQRLTEKAGFKKLGVFPNAHKVQRAETHTLAVYYAEGALEERANRPRLPLALKPFFSIVRRETGIEEAEYEDLPLPAVEDGPSTTFEAISAPQFVLRRFAQVRSEKSMALYFFPFHEPNLLLVSADGATELFVYRSGKDGHCVLNGARSKNLELGRMLESAAAYLEGMGVRYFEILVDAREAGAVNEALAARFLPSAYYPAMRWDGDGRGRDYIVMSRSLAVLDFKGIVLQPVYADYLREYFRLWADRYVGKVLP